MKFGFVQSNMDGLNVTRTPKGYESVPAKYVDSIAKYYVSQNAFESPQPEFRHGMCIVQMDEVPYRMFACSRRTSESTNEVGSACMSSTVEELDVDGFDDDKLDRLLRHAFANEFQIASADLSECDAANLSGHWDPIELMDFPDSLNEAVLKACISRNAYSTQPLFVSLPDLDFDEDVLRFLKTAYLLLPTALRAYCGYITCPISTNLVPRYVSFCFIPESWRVRFSSQTIVTTDESTSFGSTAEIFRRTRMSEGLNALADGILSIGRRERRELFAYFDGNVNNTPVIDVRLYASLYADLGPAHSVYWDIVGDEGRVAYLAECLCDASMPLDDMKVRLTAKLLGKVLDSLYAGFRGFDEVASKLKAVHRKIASNPNYSRPWYNAFLAFTQWVSGEQGANRDFKAARESLLKIFPQPLVDECQTLLQKAHENLVLNLANAIYEDVRKYPAGETDSLVQTLSGIRSQSQRLDLHDHGVYHSISRMIDDAIKARIQEIFLGALSQDRANGFKQIKVLRRAYEENALYIASAKEWESYCDASKSRRKSKLANVT